MKNFHSALKYFFGIKFVFAKLNFRSFCGTKNFFKYIEVKNDTVKPTVHVGFKLKKISFCLLPDDKIFESFDNCNIFLDITLLCQWIHGERERESALSGTKSI